MVFKNIRSVIVWLFLCTTAIFFVVSIASCGKQSSIAGPTGLNIQYRLLNLSPDMGPVNLFINYNQVNANGNPFVFEIDHGYFYVSSIDTPYQIRSALTSGTPIFSRDDILKPGAKYSLYIVGSVGDGSDTTIFTVDTAGAPPIGLGKLRFVDASPSATTGPDIYANGTLAFSSVPYKKSSSYLELPVGNYDIQIDAPGTRSVLKEIPQVTIQEGRVYTVYTYGYTTRTDSAAFSAAVITNR